MSPGTNDGEVRERQRRNAIPNDFAPIDCLTDIALRGVAAARTDLSWRTICLGLVEREFVRCAPREDSERQYRAQQSK